MVESSSLERQNILNNTPALRYVESYLGIPGRKPFGELRFTVKQVAEYFDVDEKTIKRYLESHGDELSRNGYETWTGKQLQEAKVTQQEDIDVPQFGARTKSLGVVSFRAFLNIGMLLTESAQAKELRMLSSSLILIRGYCTVKSCRRTGKNKKISDIVVRQNELRKSINQIVAEIEEK